MRKRPSGDLHVRPRGQQVPDDDRVDDGALLPVHGEDHRLDGRPMTHIAEANRKFHYITRSATGSFEEGSDTQEAFPELILERPPRFCFYHCDHERLITTDGDRIRQEAITAISL